MRQPIRLLLALAMLGLMLALVLGATGCYTTPQAGEIGVVRNGGPFDNHNIRQIVDNGSGNTWPGWYSSTHYYPVDTQQRFFKMETCAGNDGGVCRGADAPAVTVPTSDGVEVRIEARKDRQANIIRQQGYGRCRSCARQDENRSIPPSIKTYAPGAGLAVR